MYYQKYIKKSIKFSPYEKLKNLFKKKDKDFFEPIGTQVYVGEQGSGKTLSMVYHLLKVANQYPKAKIVSNIKITSLDSSRIVYFSRFDELLTIMRTLRNGTNGIIYIIDEMHNYFHSHDSKSVPLWVVNIFSQQRKQRILVLGTAQVWEDIIKTVRDRAQYVMECSRLFGIQFQRLLIAQDRENIYGQEKMKVKKLGFFIPSNRLYDSFDTFALIDSGRSIFGYRDNLPVTKVKIQSQ